MFARDKRIGPYTYVYLVENVREEGRTKQRIIANLGRKGSGCSQTSPPDASIL